MQRLFVLVFLIAVLLLTACTTAPPPAPGAVSEPPAAVPSDTPAAPPGAQETDQAVDAYPYPVENPTAGIINEDAYPAPGEAQAVEEPAYPAPESGGCNPEAAAPQRHEFVAADGTSLVGTFYPSATCSAPLALLFHQHGSSKEAWTELALWLQNRTAQSGAAAETWLPVMPADLSFAVFAIDFRGHGESGSGDGSFDDDGYLRDAQAALAFAKSLPNIAANQVITIGASIGADASVDVCLVVDGDDIADVQENQGCVGAMSLSPGNFLEVSYVEAATRLSQAPFAMEIRCLATELDGNSPALCGSAVAGQFSGTIYPGRSEHGMALLMPGLDPDVGELILDFLLDSLGMGG